MRPTRDPLGKALRQLRERADLQQGQLGRKAGVTQSNISAYELGKRAPQWPTLIRLLDAMGADLLDLCVKMEEPGRLTETQETLRQRFAADPPALEEEGRPTGPHDVSGLFDRGKVENPLDYLVDAVIDRLAERTVMRHVDTGTEARAPVPTKERNRS